MKRIAILGSTGSIGRNTLEVIRQHPDRFQVTALAAGSNVEEMVKQVEAFRPTLVSMATEQTAQEVRERASYPVEVVVGEAGLLEVATHPDASDVMSALVGSRGLRPTLDAIRAGKTIHLANKETLVMAGAIVMAEAKQHGVSIVPVDSEHSAIFQCLNGERKQEVRRLIVTASGGAFRDWSREELHHATREQALRHPNWSMGAKVTIDSATMMNKGLEVIEAHWLFDLPYGQVDVLIHPESIIHSMVEFVDGSVMAQLGVPDMKGPIQYALSYPERLPLESKRLNLAEVGRLHFREVDVHRFPCLRMAYEAGRAGGTVPTVLNAANEVAVERFLAGEIAFLDIESIIESVLSQHTSQMHPDLETLFEADRWARDVARRCEARVG